MVYIDFSDSKAKILKRTWYSSTGCLSTEYLSTGYIMIADKVMKGAEDAGIFNDVVGSKAGNNKNRYYCLAANKENLSFVRVMTEGNGYSDYVIVSTVANVNGNPVNIPRNLKELNLTLEHVKTKVHDPGRHRTLVYFGKRYRLGLMVKYLEMGKVDVENRVALPILDEHHRYADFDYRCESIALLTKEEHKEEHHKKTHRAHNVNTVINTIDELKEFVSFINSNDYYNYFHEREKRK